MLHKLKSACFIRKKPTLNKCVFKCFAKVAGPTVKYLNSTGNSFQQLGPATAKALKPQSVLWLGTTRSPRTADLFLKQFLCQAICTQRTPKGPK